MADRHELSSTGVALSTTSAQFTYTPLRSNGGKSQIRLLEMLTGGDSPQRPLRFKIRIFEVPAVNVDYSAISYAWGNPGHERTIFIDSSILSVRPNCHLALEQAYQQWHAGMLTSPYIWIDSVCIDQSDTAEKNHQVAMMSRIYANAVRVLSCVGQHADNSQYPIAIARIIAAYHCQGSLSPCIDCWRLWWDWAEDHDSGYFATLLTAYDTFANRPYWTRIWIVQEIFLAKDLWVVCGADMIPANALKTLDFFLVREANRFETLLSKGPSSKPMQTALTGNLIQLEAAFFKFASSKCTLRQDHLFALLGIIHWGSNTEPIEPDYGKSPLELAIDVAAYVHLQLIPRILATFGINGEDGDVVRRLAESRKRVPDPEAMTSEPPIFKRLHYSLSVNCSFIDCDPDGNITAALTKVPRRESISPWNVQDGIADLWKRYGNQAPMKIMADTACAGLICCAASVGDILVPLHFDMDSPPPGQVLLVLRPRDEAEYFDLVGQAVLTPSWRLGLQSHIGPEPQPELFPCRVEVSITAEEAVLLHAQDMARLAAAHGYFVSGRWQRTVTQVCSHPLGAARITKRFPPMKRRC